MTAMKNNKLICSVIFFTVIFVGANVLMESRSEATDLDRGISIKPAVSTFSGIVSWVDLGTEGYPVLIKTQAVGPNGLEGGVNTVFTLYQVGNQFYEVSQFHASNNGRILTFFLTDTYTLGLKKTVSLYILNLDAKGKLVGNPNQIILEEGHVNDVDWPILTDGDQLQAGTSF